MKGSKILRTLIIALVCVGMVVPNGVVLAAGMPQAKQVQISDVALAANGMLTGQVVDQQGIGLANVPVSVRQQGREITKAVTDGAGRFAVSGLRGGTCQLLAANGQAVVRVWTANAAPPIAKTNVMIVSGGSQVLRAQFGGGIGPWVLPALAAGGIIAGVAVATSNSSTTPASP